jgi:Peptidase family M48
VVLLAVGATAVEVAVLGLGLTSVLEPAWQAARCCERVGPPAVRLEPTLGQHQAGDGHDLLVLPNPGLFADGIAGQPSRVVVSGGLVDTPADDELAAVPRHEATHLRHHQERYLLVARVVEHTLGAVPLVRRSAAVLRCALERWADDEAATNDADPCQRPVRAGSRHRGHGGRGELAACVTAATVAGQGRHHDPNRGG